MVRTSGTATALESLNLHSRGHLLDVSENAFGTLEDSSALLGDVAALRERMQEDGYLFIRGYHNRDEVIKARKVLTDRLAEDGFLDSSEPSLEAVIAPKLKIMNSKSAFRPPTEDEDGKPVSIKAYNADDLTKSNAPLRDLFYGERQLGFFEKFLGGAIRHYNYIWFRVVSPGMGTAPHCDWVYMSRGTSNLFTSWIPIGDTPMSVGGLMILENSHRKAEKIANYLNRDVDTYCTNRGNAKAIESGEKMYEWDGLLSKNPVTLREKLGGRWLTADFEAGDILIFTMRTVHASLDNNSNRIRLSGDSRYQLASEPADERYIVENPVPFDLQFKRGRVC
ncbi:MAG: phytanoyl-CoA dioxygenase family protein [Chthoniobacterales bacterium]